MSRTRVVFVLASGSQPARRRALPVRSKARQTCGELGAYAGRLLRCRALAVNWIVRWGHDYNAGARCDAQLPVRLQLPFTRARRAAVGAADQMDRGCAGRSHLAREAWLVTFLVSDRVAQSACVATVGKAIAFRHKRDL